MYKQRYLGKERLKTKCFNEIIIIIMANLGSFHPVHSMLYWIVWYGIVFDIETVLMINWIVQYRTVLTFNYV